MTMFFLRQIARCRSALGTSTSTTSARLNWNTSQQTVRSSKFIMPNERMLTRYYGLRQHRFIGPSCSCVFQRNVSNLNGSTLLSLTVENNDRLVSYPTLKFQSCAFSDKSPQIDIVRNAHNDTLNRLREKSLKAQTLKLKKTKIKAKEVKETVEETVRGWKEDIVFTIPNLLTSSRIVLSPILGYLVLQESYSWACGLFVIAGITDLLDGYIARNFPNQASAFGSYLDPLADKFLACILFMSLTMVNLIPVPLTALVIARDVSLIVAAFYIRYMTLPPPKTLKRYFDVTHATAQLHPTFISKLNTAVQLSLVTLTLGAPVFGYIDHIMLHTLWYVTAGTTIASGITYIFAQDTFKILQQKKKKKK